ncbi:MAG: ComEA family DNA-binding protein [Gemmatimonadaceae bacterium]
MPTPAERKALLFFAAVVALGAGVRVVRTIARDQLADPAATAALSEQLRRVDSARAAGKGGSGRRRSSGKKAAATEAPVDVDTASATLIETLNGVGPALAKRIVADRDSFGAFGSIEGLGRVRGIGPALSAKLAPQVTFSRLPRPQNAVVAPPPGRRTARKKVQHDRGFP